MPASSNSSSALQKLQQYGRDGTQTAAMNCRCILHTIVLYFIPMGNYHTIISARDRRNLRLDLARHAQRDFFTCNNKGAWFGFSGSPEQCVYFLVAVSNVLAYFYATQNSGFECICIVRNYVDLGRPGGGTIRFEANRTKRRPAERCGALPTDCIEKSPIF